MTGQQFIAASDGDSGKAVSLSGDWTLENSAAIIAALKTADIGGAYTIDAGSVGRMDSWGAIQIRKIADQAGHAHVNLTDKQKKTFEFVPAGEKPIDEKDAPSGASAFFETIGRNTSDALKTMYGLVSFVGEIAVVFGRNVRHPSRFRIHSIIRHIDETGFRALPIIGLLAILISMVISYQAATQLQKFGANIFTIDLTVISLLREMGVLVTAIMVAGRSGSAFAAEIGVMKLREEVDALRTMGFDPIEMLVLPRVIAMMITLPILAFLADIVGLAGGALISIALLDIPLDQYIDRVDKVANVRMFFVGLIKAPVFAFVITIIGAYQGMNVSGSAESVGRLTTTAVVQSIFIVILIDALFSIVFASLGI